MNEHSKAFKKFEEIVEEGIKIECVEEDLIVYGVKAYYGYDETACEEHFSDFLDSEGLAQLVSVEDCLKNDLTWVLEEQCLNSFRDGQFKQFNSQFEDLYAPDFVSYLYDFSSLKYEIEILRHIVNGL